MRKECFMVANNRPETTKKKKTICRTVAVILWLLIWHIAAKYIGKEVFLPSPGNVFWVLITELLPSPEFYRSLLTSLVHITLGFLLGSGLGILLALLSFINEYVECMVWLPVKIIKSVPVASFVILSLLWFDADGLAIFVPGMVVLPIIYTNTLTGLRQTDSRYQDMARIFRLSGSKRLRYIYFPQVIPYIMSASSLAVGMAWKSGIAAEIIGLVKYSIGNELYKTKLYLMIPELFAWTVVIVCLSIICEWLFQRMIGLTEQGKE